MLLRMSRSILELKSIKIAPEKVHTIAVAKRIAKLKDFDLREEYFEPVYHPADLVRTSRILKKVRPMWLMCELMQWSGLPIQAITG